MEPIHPDTPAAFRTFGHWPIQALSYSSKQWLAWRLDPERMTLSQKNRILQDWRGVAEVLNFMSLDIDNFQRAKSPTMEMISHWTKPDKPEAFMVSLINALCVVERFDILSEEEFEANLVRDTRKWSEHLDAAQKHQKQAAVCNEPLQVPEVQSSDPDAMDEDITEGEFRNITVNEVNTGIPEYFDAFVSYTQNDFEFVRQMMNRLEDVHGLKLCVANRDLMPGAAKYVIMAKLIKERCKKMIIVLSPDYINSMEGAFQTRFAHSLAPGAQERKLIPVVYKNSVIPDILNHITIVDYTRCDVIEWFWQRLANSLKKEPRPQNIIPPHGGLQYCPRTDGALFDHTDQESLCDSDDGWTPYETGRSSVQESCGPHQAVPMESIHSAHSGSTGSLTASWSASTGTASGVQFSNPSPSQSFVMLNSSESGELMTSDVILPIGRRPQAKAEEKRSSSRFLQNFRRKKP